MTDIKQGILSAFEERISEECELLEKEIIEVSKFLVSRRVPFDLSVSIGVGLALRVAFAKPVTREMVLDILKNTISVIEGLGDSVPDSLHYDDCDVFKSKPCSCTCYQDLTRKAHEAKNRAN